MAIYLEVQHRICQAQAIQLWRRKLTSPLDFGECLMSRVGTKLWRDNIFKIAVIQGFQEYFENLK